MNYISKLLSSFIFISKSHFKEKEVTGRQVPAGGLAELRDGSREGVGTSLGCDQQHWPPASSLGWRGASRGPRPSVRALLPARGTPPSQTQVQGLQRRLLQSSLLMPQTQKAFVNHSPADPSFFLVL